MDNLIRDYEKKIKQLEQDSIDKRRLKIEASLKRKQIKTENVDATREYKLLAKDFQKWITDENYPKSMQAIADLKKIYYNQLRETIRMDNREKRVDICLIIGAKLDLLEEIQDSPLQVIKDIEEMNKAIKKG